MSNYENFKTLFDTGVENTKSAVIDSIKSVFSKENVTIDVTLKDEEASKIVPSELKFPLYSIELFEQNHHQLLMDTDSIKALSSFVDGVEDDAELNDESAQKIQASLNEILKGSKLSSNDFSILFPVMPSYKLIMASFSPSSTSPSAKEIFTITPIEVVKK